MALEANWKLCFKIFKILILKIGEKHFLVPLTL